MLLSKPRSHRKCGAKPNQPLCWTAISTSAFRSSAFSNPTVMSRARYATFTIASCQTAVGLHVWRWKSIQAEQQRRVVTFKVTATRQVGLRVIGQVCTLKYSSPLLHPLKYITAQSRSPKAGSASTKLCSTDCLLQYDAKNIRQRLPGRISGPCQTFLSTFVLLETLHTTHHGPPIEGASNGTP